MKNKLLLNVAALAAITTASCSQLLAQNVLNGRAVLPAATFAAGPVSGNYIGAGPIAGQAVPFPGQPVQGISALIDNRDGTFMGLPDNGFGSTETSADFYLRLYRLKPSFKTATGGSGALEVLSFIEFNDKNNKIPFAIVNHFSPDRKLTGADFDVESVQRAADSTYWVGDEFGPFLLHFDKTGTLLDAPVELPDFENAGKFVRSPQSPFNEESSALRLMNAFRTHAQLNGNTKAPVFSPNASLIDDLDTATAAGDRKSPAAGSGLTKASTDIFNVALLKSAGYPVVAWTVNDSASIAKLLNLGVSGIISDYPELLVRLASGFDKNNDNQPDFLDADGLIDIRKLDVQAHRGGRGPRPENTLPAFENGLNALVTTLEMDCGITKDGIPVISHDPHIQYTKALKTNNVPYGLADEVLIKDLTLAELQSTFTLDKLLGAAYPQQLKDTTLSPVSVAFIKTIGLPHTYTIPSLKQVLDFVDFYVTYYTTGEGKNHQDAVKRAKNAARVRFNIETKFNPRTDNDATNVPFIARTLPADTFAVKIAKVIVAKGLTERADIQSFAFQTLLKVQKDFPSIRTVYLFTDGPKTPVQPGNDGGNLQPQGGNTSPWLGGLYWPYRSTRQSNPFRAQRSGGFEGTAITIKKDKLYPLLELPLAGHDSKTILLHEFDLASKTYTGKRYKYKFGEGTNIGDFCFYNETNGLIIERDNGQGPPAKIKRIYKVTLNTTDTLTKTLVADLMDLQDLNGLSAGLTTLSTDFGTGTAFKFPYQTIESVVVQDSANLIVINDNNYPFSVGRHIGNPAVTTDDVTDDNEMIRITLDAAHQLSQVITSLQENETIGSVMTDISCYPNPYSQHTTLSFHLHKAGTVTITMTDMLGKEVKQFPIGIVAAGAQRIELDAAGLTNGLYTIRIKTADQELNFRTIKAE